MAVHSILVNLVENAVKYSGSNHDVLLTLIKDSQHAVIRVSDQGTGISAEDKTRVFDKFYRAGNEETRKTKGTGLGLYIVKYLVEKHQGSIAVKDNLPRGSIFEIRLKLS
jgi:signal transduction histidine kinase